MRHGTARKHSKSWPFSVDNNVGMATGKYSAKPVLLKKDNSTLVE